ncbi:MAG: NAD(P)H-dependent oxidoreductase subunit E [Spirochaetales bacterium]|nr:NAD(P)H-dependent oxidoreductase subunit E [Spirochaetales bacterium]
MSNDLSAAVKEICLQHNNDRIYLMDILRKVQVDHGSVSDEAIDAIADAVSIPRVEVESTATFYAFLSKEKKGKIVIRLCNDIIDRLAGVDVVAKAFKEELGVDFGETTADGLITLEYTPCIGMSDQAPAALVNDEVITYLSSDKAREIVRTLKKTGDPKKLVSRLGDGNNASPLVNSMVHNNIRKKGDVIFADYPDGAGLKKALTMSPVEVINEVTNARLRGRGGAGFPAGMKWQFTRAAEDPEKYIICNADEGEPGTFKDRVLLTDYPERLFEGMTIAGYAIGAQQGILYLRAEYAYLSNLLENVLAKKRKDGVLGKAILGKKAFDFDIRIQFGAGAYVCGEETALISSCEGSRGDPKNRPPFPAQKGFMGHPTCVNNVETYVAVVRLIDMGAAWFTSIGSKGSSGTKLLSISGDCHAPGVYEYPFGITIKQLLQDVGAEDAKAVQIGGPSGQMIGKEDFNRTICYDDLATGGSVMIFGADRNILEVADYFMEFFIEESCGYCTPCRVGNVLLKGYLERVMNGQAEEADLEVMKSLARTVKTTSRCGLGQTSPNPILTTLAKFYPEYTKLLKTSKDGFKPSFNIQEVLQESQSITGRKSVHFS